MSTRKHHNDPKRPTNWHTLLTWIMPVLTDMYSEYHAMLSIATATDSLKVVTMTLIFLVSTVLAYLRSHKK